VAFAAVGLCVSQATRAAAPRNGLIAYELDQVAQTCDGCGDDETDPGGSWVETIRPDGSRPRRLACTSGRFSGCEDGSPAFSRDGRRLAITGSVGLVIMRPAGRRLVRLPGVAGSSLSWSPDGRRLAYTTLTQPPPRGLDGTFLLGVHIADLAGRTRVLNAMGSGEVSWSRSGRLAWDTTGDERAPKGDIWTGDPSGRLQRRVLRRATRPRWSFSGRRLGFFCRSGLCVSRPDGSHRRVLARACELRPLDLAGAGGFAWSPDGKAVACVSKRGSLIIVSLRSKRVQLVRRASHLTGAGYIGAIDWQREPKR
jgi:WD40 repeat protein